MKKIIFSLLLLLANGCFAQKTFSDFSNSAFTIKYPAGWDVSVGTHNSVFLAAHNDRPPEEKVIGAYASVVIEDSIPVGITLMQYTKKSIDENHPNLLKHGYKILYAASVDINAYVFEQIVYQQQMGANFSRYFFYCMFENGKAYRFTFYHMIQNEFVDDFVNQYPPMFEYMMYSFKTK